MGASQRDALLLAMALGVGCGSPSVRTQTKAPPQSAPPQSAPPLARDAAPEPSERGPSPSLTRGEIRLVVRAKLPDIRACFEAGRSRSPELRGRVLLRFTIDPSGKPQDVHVQEDELGEALVGGCLTSLLPSWQFPRPRGGEAIELTYPFNFRSEQSLRAAGLPRVEGTVRPEAVGAVFDARRSEIDPCIPERGSGTIGVAFNIDDHGAVTRISSYADTLPEGAGSCVLQTVSSWVFPPAASEDEARVNHDLSWP